MKKDFSIHFTVKGQEMAQIEKAFDEFQSKDIYGTLDLSEDNSIVLHHCFLPEKDVVSKGWDNSIHEFLNTLTDANKVCYYHSDDDGNLGMSRLNMLRNIERLGGVSVFIGEIKDGVKEEYDLAKCLGVHIIEIPLTHEPIRKYTRPLCNL